MRRSGQTGELAGYGPPRQPSRSLLVLGLLIPYLFLRLRRPGWRSPDAADAAAEAAEAAAQRSAEPRDTEGGAT
ncbi:hypothetical protein ACFV4G_02830 [Kitasatospora sp. NPDC059747]|uniref:hypothetical protein n=1 Tax=Kitasatospora sp. NPDC059747 TaxID=3346930 RepID=UPI0036554000